MMARTSLAKLSAHEGAESMNRQRATRATVDSRQPDEPAAMSLRCGWCQSHARPRKWPGGVAGALYAGRVATGVVRQQARPDPEARSRQRLTKLRLHLAECVQGTDGQHEAEDNHNHRAEVIFRGCVDE